MLASRLRTLYSLGQRLNLRYGNFIQPLPRSDFHIKFKTNSLPLPSSLRSPIGFITQLLESSHELGLPADLAAEWTSFCHHLANTGIQLTTSDDQPMWTGGDRSGYRTVQNVYLEIVNYNWPNATGGWKHRIWSWSLPLKIKLFSWLTLANKINTWDVLQKKGWIGPSICQLCFLEEESAQHIFIHSAFARSVWAIITAALNLNHTWDGHTFPDCFEHWSKISYLTLNLPPLVCWFTWTERNNYIFENRPPSTTSVAYKSLGLLPYLERLSPKS